jgi:hypothetical protein
MFSSSESVSNDDYIGLGNSSTNILRNTLVVGKNCIAKSLVFNIRELSKNIPYTATLYVNGSATSFIATIPDGSTSYKITVTNSITLNQMDLITLHIAFSSGALQNGACATLLVE